MTYREFLESKIELATDSGFEVDKSRINKALKPHQSDAVAWALKGGRRALFESFGLGKTAQEIEFCHLAAEHTGGRALIVLPLGVKQEFTRDAVELLGYEKPEYCRTMEEVEASTSQIVLTNYERVRDGDIDPSYFAATSLDEASVLRSFGSKTYQTFLDKFKNVPYKLVATATPSPNKYKELIHYAGYLEVMDTGQALTRFFQRDSTKANNLTLYPNMEDEFWLWVSSWALFITKPSDLNPDYSDDGYVLPPLDVRWHEIPIHYGDSVDRDGQMELFTQASTGLKEAAKIKRESIDARVEKMKEIVDSSPEDHFILWHDQEAERHAIKKALPETVDIYGSMDYDLREQRVIDFSNGKTRLFATKKSISGSGCNFQRFCHREIFVGIDYEFNDFIQAVHRCYRFLQHDTVVIDIIYMENEREIKDALIEKWKNHNHMVKKMIEIVKKYGIRAVRPLAPKTMQRIARGLKKFVLDNPEPFIIQCNHGGDRKPQDIRDPMPTITGKHGYGVVEPYMVQIGQTGFSADRSKDVREPLTTIVSKNEHCLISPTLIQYHSETNSDEVRGQGIENPIMTVDSSNRYGLVTSFLSKFYKTGIGQDEREPLHTVTTSAGHFGEVRAFLIKYYGEGTGQDIEQPLDTVTSRDRFGLVTIQGVEYQIVDIGLRMLEPKELYGCQGFPDDYIIDHDSTGKTYSRSEQVRRCGNAVCPPIPAAMVRSNLPELCVRKRMPNMRIGEEENGQLCFV